MSTTTAKINASTLAEAIARITKADTASISFICGSSRPLSLAVIQMGAALKTTNLRVPKQKRPRSRHDPSKSLFNELERGCPDDKIKMLVGHGRIAFSAGDSAIEARIKGNAIVLRASHALLGYVWAQMTMDFELYMSKIRDDNKGVATTRKLVSLLRYDKSEDKELALLQGEWSKLKTGYAFSTMVQYLEVGRLLRMFPRLKFFSDISRLLGNEKKVWDYMSVPSNHEYWQTLPEFDGTEQTMIKIDVELNASTTSDVREQQAFTEMTMEVERIDEEKRKKPEEAKETEEAGTSQSARAAIDDEAEEGEESEVESEVESDEDYEEEEEEPRHRSRRHRSHRHKKLRHTVEDEAPEEASAAPARSGPTSPTTDAIRKMGAMGLF